MAYPATPCPAVERICDQRWELVFQAPATTTPWLTILRRMVPNSQLVNPDVTARSTSSSRPQVLAPTATGRPSSFARSLPAGGSAQRSVRRNSSMFHLLLAPDPTTSLRPIWVKMALSIQLVSGPLLTSSPLPVQELTTHSHKMCKTRPPNTSSAQERELCSRNKSKSIKIQVPVPTITKANLRVLSMALVPARGHLLRLIQLQDQAPTSSRKLLDTTITNSDYLTLHSCIPLPSYYLSLQHLYEYFQILLAN